jgi:uncharacterized protein YndB with AHSA1/START domain
MNDYGTFTDKETLKLERLLPASPETVWEFLTQSDKKAKWLASGDVEPKVGGKVTHHFDHRNISDEPEPLPEKYKDIGETSTSFGKVTAWEPYSLLSYTWDEGDDGVSEVTFELSKVGDDNTRLVLTHSRIPDSDEFRIGVSAGWHTHLNILRNIISGKNPGSFWNVHMPLEEDYKKRIG